MMMLQPGKIESIQEDENEDLEDDANEPQIR